LDEKDVMNKKYFESQTFNSQSELSQAEAIARGNYVLCYFDANNEPDYAELVEDAEIYRIVFFNRNWPDKEILQKQLEATIKVPFEVNLKSNLSENGEIRKSYNFTPEGQLDLIVERHINLDGDLQSEFYRDEHQNLLGRIEYEYDQHTGDLAFSREYAADGGLISEDEF
jgi:hypothetical protein